MNCPKCDDKLKVRQVYTAGSIAKTIRAECVTCDKVYTLVTFLVGEAEERGQGAFALAKKLAQRNERPDLDL